MKTREIVSVAAALCFAGCAGYPGATSFPSPGSLAPTTNVASRGSVYFVSSTEAWEVTQPPDRLRTVILQTLDSGGHWRIWGIAPEAATPDAFSATDVVLVQGTALLRSTDGSHWTVRTMPTFGQPFFLPDLQHGWLNGFDPSAPLAAPAATPVSGKGGGGGGKGGTSAPPGGKGGAASAAPAPCQDKGCQPTALWSTTDGGASWRQVMRSTFAVSNGAMYFWSPSQGMISNGVTVMLTSDGGVTWRTRTFMEIGSDTQASQSVPTMFDALHGVLPIAVNSSLFLSQTSDGGRTWTSPRPVNQCAGCTGSMVFLDELHWIDYSQGVNLTSDGGQTWKKATTTNPVKDASAVEVVAAPSREVFVVAPGLFVSETGDWGGHWHAFPLPDIYPSYSGFDGNGGWVTVSTGPCCV